MMRKLLSVLIASAVVALAIPATAADEFAQVAQAADRLAKSGRSSLISADRLRALLTDADPGNDPVLISVCAPDDFAKGHLPGSVNVPRGAFWKPANLAKLPSANRMLVLYCYTGTGAVGPANVLALMGYDAVQLEWGLMGWSKSDAALGTAARFPATQKDFPVDRSPAQVYATHALPSLATGKTGLNDILVARADRVEAADRSVSMTAEQVQGLMTDADAGNDPFVLDVRSPAEHARGHLKAAINVPAAQVFEAGQLAKLPQGRRIVVVDANGQTAVGISYLLSVLGYDARGLQYGMMGWSKDDALVAPLKRFPGDAQRDFPLAVLH